MRSDALVQRTSVPVSLALNGQQFHEPVPFSYTGHAYLSAVRPYHGPAAGGTRLTVYGANLGGGAAQEYGCRFGSGDKGWHEVAATLGATTDVYPTLRCDTPPLALTRPSVKVELQVSKSNGQEFSSSEPLVSYTYYLRPVLDVVTPPAGPLAGGTLVRIYGAHLHGGVADDRRCRFGGETATPGSLDLFHHNKTLPSSQVLQFG